MTVERGIDPPDHPMRLPAWIADAPCSRLDPDLFDLPHGTPESRSACRKCPVQDECLEWLLLWPTQHGYGAGLTEEQRRALRRNRQMPTHKRRRVR